MASSIAQQADCSWLSSFLDHYYQRNPVNATFIGMHDFDANLPDYSVEGLARVADEQTTLARQLASIDPNVLSPIKRVDLHIARGWLDIQEWERTTPNFANGNPSFVIGEAAFSIISLLLRPFAPVDDRVESTIQRLEKVPAFLSGAISSIGSAPPAWIDKAKREIEGTLNLLSDGIDKFIAEFTPTCAKGLQDAAKTATDGVREFADKLSALPVNDSPQAYACGSEGLDLLINKGHFLGTTADEIERYALELLAENRAALASRATLFGESDWRSVLSQLGNYHPTAEGYETRYQEVWEEAQAYALEHNLVTWPDYPIRYTPRPAWTRSFASSLYFLFYRAPSAFDNAPLVDYLIAPLDPELPANRQQQFLRATNDSVIKMNHVIHHGGLGHHVQNWNAYHTAESALGRIAAVDCANRIALFAGGTMAEGWACYSVDLMDEVGYLSPLESFSQLHARARMAARAIVDIRLQTGKITLEEGAAFYRDEIGMEAGAALSETVKNSMYPGTALMYLTGSDRIRSLRKTIEATEGSEFSLRKFHDTLLSFGSVPVALVEDLIVRRSHA